MNALDLPAPPLLRSPAAPPPRPSPPAGPAATQARGGGTAHDAADGGPPHSTIPHGDDHAACGARPPGHVTLAGAGPGDPELLTLKALRAIQAADMVLHDQLVSPEILALIPPQAERIDVGKTCGHHRYSQAAIIELMLALARRGRRVLRLKGGDPNIFGRGGEEAQALAAAGIPFDFIPGISAAQAAASCAGIPLTHRDHARAVVYATAHMREDGQALRDGRRDTAPGPREAAPAEAGEPDWAALARPEQTVVLYMGVTRLERVCARLREHGLAADTPAAVVERASRPGQRTVRGTLQTLPALAAEARVQGPALIIVGSVVQLAEVLAPSAMQAHASAD
ncbi:MAG: uroporphyrinogen-III C-methyltransferase [Burkholderiales bacterium]|nr:uroporphyrinogen-III C-methyltransferase [Burkholderiales bacterium]